MTQSRIEGHSPHCGDVSRSRDPNPRNWPDRGSATVIWLAYLAMIVMLGTVGLAIGEFSAGRAQAAGAADLGALAAADRALRGDQCSVARRVVLANGAQLRGCTMQRWRGLGRGGEHRHGRSRGSHPGIACGVGEGCRSEPTNDSQQRPRWPTHSDLPVATCG